MTAIDIGQQDKLETIVELQRAIMKRFGLDGELSPEKKLQETHRFLTAIICEVVEILHEKGGIEKGWKNWETSGQDPDPAYIKKELIDILHFTIELLILWGADAEEIFRVYSAKNAENHKRYDTGY